MRDHTVLPATHTFIHKWNEPYVPLLPTRRASPHFGWYSFPVPQRVGGRVGLGGLVKYRGGLSAEDGHPSQYWRACHRVTSLISPTMLPLRHAATKEPCIRWGSRSPMWRGNFEGKKGPAQDMPCLVRQSVYSLQFTRGQHWHVEWSVLDGMHIGATWRIRLNHLCVLQRCGLMSDYFDYLLLLLVCALSLSRGQTTVRNCFPAESDSKQFIISERNKRNFVFWELFQLQLQMLKMMYC